MTPSAAILIMCQGEQRRLAQQLGDQPKQLLKVDGETILERTLRLIREVDASSSITVIGRDTPWFTGACRYLGGLYGCERVEPEVPGSCIVDGIVAARPLWRSPRTIALLGDVVWSRAGLRRVLADQRPLVFAGTSHLSTTQGEVFAASWDPTITLAAGRTPYSLMTSCPCRSDPKAKRVRTFAQQQGGHMRRLLWWAQHHQQYRGKEPMSELYLPIDDFTDDIDTPADLDRLGELSAFAAAEREQ